MIKIIENGDILTNGHDFIFIPVNQVGAFGAGLAGRIKKEYFHIYREYKIIFPCLKTSGFQVGKEMLGSAIPIYFPTKDHWKNDSDLTLIVNNLQKFVDVYKESNYTNKSFGIPALGCRMGNLSWELVKPIILHYLSLLNRDDFEFYLYEPKG